MKLLKELSEAFGAPGFEEEVRAIVLREVRSLVDEVTVDKMGNVIAIRKANNSSKKRPLRIMLAGHMDEIGFVVKHIDKDGFIRLNPLGYFDPTTLIAKRVMIHGEKKKIIGVVGSKPIHVTLHEKDNDKKPQLKDLFVDTGLSDDQVRKAIRLGDSVTLCQEFLEVGENVCGKSLDNRIAVWVLLKTLQQIHKQKIDCDVYAVFTTQEEVGVRGATTAAFGVEPDVGVAVDVTVACDIPDVDDHEHVTKLGQGTAIKVCDGYSISDPSIVRFLRKLAEEEKIKYQMEILPNGGTDAAGIQRSRAGVPVVTISVPTRYLHTVVEMANKKDLNNTVSLLSAFIRNVSKFKALQ